MAEHISTNSPDMDHLFNLIYGCIPSNVSFGHFHSKRCRQCFLVNITIHVFSFFFYKYLRQTFTKIYWFCVVCLYLFTYNLGSQHSEIRNHSENITRGGGGILIFTYKIWVPPLWGWAESGHPLCGLTKSGYLPSTTFFWKS